MVGFVYKLKKVWDKVGSYADNVLEEVWGIAKKSPCRINGNFYKYLDDISFPSFGPQFASISTYNSKFKQVFSEVSDKIGPVHHAVPKTVRTKYPQLNVTKNQMHSLENLRGIPSDGSLDHQTITNYWQAFYNTNPDPSLQDIFEYTKFIDDEFGHLFIPPVRK